MVQMKYSLQLVGSPRISGEEVHSSYAH